MNRKVTIQPSFEISSLFKYKNQNIKENNIHLYKSGRYALFFGLKKLLEKSPELKDIYIPNFVCPQVLMPIEKLDLDQKFYQIDKTLSLDKKYLSNSVNDNSIVMVINYFGFPSDWEYFNELKLKTGCTLIADNCHSMLSTYKGRNLSEYGDLSFNSFRKILPVLSGSQLFFNNKKYELDSETQTRIPSLSELLYMLMSLKPGFIKKHLGDTKLVGNYRPDGNNKYFFDEESVNTIDIISKNYFLSSMENYRNINIKRRENYMSWLNFLPASDFIFLNELKLNNDITPYVFPCIARNEDVMNRWISWGRDKNISIINWSNKRDDLDNNLKLMLLFPIVPNQNIKLVLENASK